MNEMRQRYLLGSETHVVKTTRRQDEFKKDKRYGGTVGMTRILADQ